MLKQYIHADGHMIWGDLAVSCIRGEDGHVQNLIGQVTDTTKEVTLTQQLAASERNYRLLVENAGDLVCRVRGDKFVWVSPNFEEVLGAPAEHWLGRRLAEVLPAADAEAHAARWKKLSEGGTIKQRVQVTSVDGVTHWFHLHAKPLYDDGHQDGVSAALRLVDDEVAAEQAADEARRRQAIADERFRRSMDHAAVGMCQLNPEGRLIDLPVIAKWRSRKKNRAALYFPH